MFLVICTLCFSTLDDPGSDDNESHFLCLGDSLARSNGAYFSTLDADNDNKDGSCAKEYKSGWWHNNCFLANLNGLYRKASKADATELCWYSWGNTWRSIKSAVMMIRPKQ